MLDEDQKSLFTDWLEEHSAAVIKVARDRPRRTHQKPLLDVQAVPTEGTDSAEVDTIDDAAARFYLKFGFQWSMPCRFGCAVVLQRVEMH